MRGILLKTAAVGLKAAVGVDSSFLPKWAVVWVGIGDTNSRVDDALVGVADDFHARMFPVHCLAVVQTEAIKDTLPILHFDMTAADTPFSDVCPRRE